MGGNIMIQNEDYEIVNKEAKEMFLIFKDNETKKSYL